MSELSYLEKLLDGVEVEWLPLAKVCRLINGRAYKQEELLSKGKYPVLRVGNFFTNQNWYYSDLELDQDKYCDNGDLLYAWSASFGPRIWHGGKSIYHYHIWKVVPDSNLICKQFLYYLLQWDTKALKDAHSTGSTMLHISKTTIEKRLVPIPCPDNPEKSLAIQSEIVRILDKFTALTAELTAELNMRKKQYNYYRDQLLSFEDGEVEWKALGTICQIGDGNHSSKYPKANEMIEQGIPFIRGTNMVNGTICNQDMKYISKEKHNELKKGHLKAFDVLIANRGEVGKVAYVPEGYSGSNLNSQLAWLRANPEIIINRYLFFILCSSTIQNKLSGEGGALQQLTIKNIKNIQIPVPSITVQSNIVSFLDKFDSLTNSISEGLPREIELRQKQYEYYRDLLFSFPKPDTVSN